MLFVGVKWSRTHGCFYTIYGDKTISKLFHHIRKKDWFVDYSSWGTLKEAQPEKKNKPEADKQVNHNKHLNTESEKLLNRFREWMVQQRYAGNSIKIYTSVLSAFFSYYRHKEPDAITQEDIEHYNTDFIIKKGYSSTYQNQAINAIKLFYIKMQDRKHEFEMLERPRRSKPLPKVIGKDDVRVLLKQIKNTKHKLALSMIYGLGLRRGELINLRLMDIDSKRRTVLIRNAKGNKDRVVPLPDSLLNHIKDYYLAEKPVKYLIEGSVPGKKYSATSLQQIFDKHMTRVKPGHEFTLHCLRHSIATHMLDNGTDLRYIQELLGHKSSRTTEIYTHVSIRNLQNIKNPFEDMDI